MSELQQIPIGLLDDHPQNPRLVMREDVINGIAANLNGEFPQKHVPVADLFRAMGKALRPTFAAHPF